VLLRPGGLLLNHAIATLDPEHDPLEDLFSTRYVFPDGEPLALSRVELALERARFHTQHVEGFREDYAITLRHWSRRLDERLDEAEALAGPVAHASLAPLPARGAARLRHAPHGRLPGLRAQARLIAKPPVALGERCSVGRRLPRSRQKLDWRARPADG